MIAYFDTSSLIPLLVEEAGSERAGRLWEAADTVFSSRLAYVEARSALAMAVRTGRLRTAELDDLRNRFELIHGQMAVVEVGFALVRRAGQLAEARALRGYDAVHLASAATLPSDDLVFVSGDRDLCQAAADEGFAVGQT